MIPRLSLGTAIPTTVRFGQNNAAIEQPAWAELPDRIDFTNKPAHQAKDLRFGQSRQETNPDDEPPLTDDEKENLRLRLMDSVDQGFARIFTALGLPPEEESPDAMDTYTDRLTAQLMNRLEGLSKTPPFDEDEPSS